MMTILGQKMTINVTPCSPIEYPSWFVGKIKGIHKAQITNDVWIFPRIKV